MLSREVNISISGSRLRPFAGFSQSDNQASMRWCLPLVLVSTAAAQIAAFSSPVVDDEYSKRIRANQEERTYPLPSDKEIETAETALARQPCIGDLRKWHRRYARKVDWDKGHVDHDLILFSYREAGLYGYGEGRKVGRLADLGEIDDREFRLAFGTYNLRTGTIRFDSCGSNWPDAPHKKQSR